MTMLKAFFKTVKNYILADKSTSTSSEDIVVQETFTENSLYKMPLTTQDVEWYLSQIKEKDPAALTNISRIELTSREVFFTDDVFASYNPYVSDNEKAVIKLYPMRFDFEKGLYVIANPDGKRAYVDDENARQIQLFNLGHEIGHNVFFRSDGTLYGPEVEKKCDVFSERLNLSLNANRLYSELF